MLSHCFRHLAKLGSDSRGYSSWASWQTVSACFQCWRRNGHDIPIERKRCESVMPDTAPPVRSELSPSASKPAHAQSYHSLRRIVSFLLASGSVNSLLLSLWSPSESARRQVSPSKAQDPSAFMSLRRLNETSNKAWIESKFGRKRKFPMRRKWKDICKYFCELLVRIWYGESWYCEPTARTANKMASQEAETGLLAILTVLRAFFARSSRYTISLDSRSSMSITKPQKTWGISLYVRNNLEMLDAYAREVAPPHADGGTNAAHTGQTYFITSRSDGSSAEMSAVSFSRWREDISGKGAELSRPKMERMSCRMLSTPAWRSLGEVCSLSRAGMLFCPRYLVTSADSGSTEIGVRD